MRQLDKEIVSDQKREKETTEVYLHIQSRLKVNKRGCVCVCVCS